MDSECWLGLVDIVFKLDVLGCLLVCFLVVRE